MNLEESLLRVSAIQVRPAVDADDVETALSLRWQGYRRYFSRLEDVRDRFDDGPNVTLLLAFDEAGHALGTMRILDSSRGPLEVEDYVDLQSILPHPGMRVAEATRFAIPAHPESRATKLALWKGLLEYSTSHGLDGMVGWVRRAAARDLEALQFVNLGDRGSFAHPRLNEVPHATYLADLREMEERYRRSSHALHEFFFCRTLPNIRPA